MAIANPNASKVNLKLNMGTDFEGKIIYKQKSLNGIKSDATNEDIYAVVEGLESLQTGTVEEVEREDNSSLSD